MNSITELENQVAHLKEQLDDLHAHVKDACQILGVDTDDRPGDSWTLIEACKEKMVRVLALEESLQEILELPARHIKSSVFIAERACDKNYRGRGVY